MGTQVSAADVLQGFDRDRLLELASALIRVPSFDGAEAGAITLAQDFLSREGISVRALSRDAARPNLIATIGQGHPVVVLNGHVDTVQISDREAWETDPLEPTVKGNRLYGLGAIDMKAPVAVLLLVAAHLQRVSDRLNGTLQLQVVVDEETGTYNGTSFLIEQMLAGALDRPDFVISGERSDLKVSNAERGSTKFEVEFFGRAAHTADARTKGINPIAHAARAIAALERPLDEFHPYTGHGILSVNVVKGGAFISAVPDRCLIQVDRRMIPGESNESVLGRANAAIREALKETPDTRWEIRPLLDKRGRPRYYAPSLTRWESPLVQALVHAHQKVTGEEGQPCVGAFGATDARLFRYQGIDGAVYGPSGENAHGANEYVEMQTLETQFKVLTHALSHLLGGN